MEGEQYKSVHDARVPIWGLRTTKVQTSLRSHSLLSTFVILLMESIIYKLATSEIAIFRVVSVAEQAGLGMPWSETPKARI